MTNRPPHSSFFQENPAPAPETLTNKRRTTLYTTGLVLISVLYALLALVIGLQIQVRGFTLFSSISLYAYGLITGVGILQLRGVYASSERSRKMLLEIIDQSRGYRIITDKNKDVIYANQKFKEMTGVWEKPSLQDFIGKLDRPETTGAIFKDIADRVAIGEPPVFREISCKTEGSKTLWYSISAHAITGWPGYINWRIDDITDRRKMEATIHEEQDKLKDFTDNAPVGFFSIDERGRFIFVNDTLTRWLGTDSQTLTGKARLHDFLASPPEDSAPYDCFKDGGNHQHGEILMKGSGNRIFKAAVTHSIVRNTDGSVRSRSIVYDLTAEQKMQEALEKSQDRFQRLFEEAPVGICLIDTAGTLTQCNQTFSNMLLLTEGAIINRPLLELLADKSREKARDWLDRMIRGDRAYSSIEATLKKGDKGNQFLITQLYARKSKQSNSLILHFIDLTEQKMLEQQFTQSQKMQAVGQLAGGIAHDFNNLLTAMIGFCDLLLLRHKAGDPSFGDIMQIKQNANRAANLVRQLLAFSRQQTLQPRVLDVTDILTELSHLIRRLIGANIELRISHGQDIGLIKADQGQLEQVLINLAVNARDAMKDGGGGQLSIHTFSHINDTAQKLGAGDEILPPGTWTAIEVADTGTGIPPDVLPRIFEPFFSTKEVGAGTGLGLSTVHGIVHQTGGFIGVETKIGGGTHFTVYLPRHTESQKDGKIETPEEKYASADLTGTAHILLVEDEDAVRTFSSRALANKGYRVLEASGGKSALELIEEKKPELELLITDVVMPEMDGPTLAKIVRQKLPGIKIIFISGYAEDKFKEQLGEEVYFLPKPFTLKQLAAKVKEVLEK